MPKPKRSKKTTRRAAGKKATPKPQLQHASWGAVELETLNPLPQRQFLSGDNVMVARIILKKGCVVPLHSHHNEQISCVSEGALKFAVDGKDLVVRAGEVIVIPPHMPHLVEALSDAVSLDIFSPPRADWIAKSDQYLREPAPKSGKLPRKVG